MTIQNTFNELVAQLRALGGMRSVHDDGTCAYRGLNDRQCAVGHLIPDSKYHPNMEGEACDSGMVLKILKEEGHNPTLCRIFQCIHDQAEPEHWEALYTVLADKLELNFIPLETNSMSAANFIWKIHYAELGMDGDDIPHYLRGIHRAEIAIQQGKEQISKLKQLEQLATIPA